MGERELTNYRAGNEGGKEVVESWENWTGTSGNQEAKVSQVETKYKATNGGNNEGARPSSKEKLMKSKY